MYFDTPAIVTIHIKILIAFAVLRGILHYAEQACNHYIAFKLLAIIRHKVFAALRKLCPAKLEGRDKGNLISIITNDIELLEVFYAHTISPIAIAFFTSLIMVIFYRKISYLRRYLGACFLSFGRCGRTVMEWKEKCFHGNGISLRYRRIKQLCIKFSQRVGRNHTVWAGRKKKTGNV